jgi:sulfite exporter TauE/SafE/copper chaperone CopZ
MSSVSFRIAGMSCVNCRGRIERELRRAAGVRDAVVNFNTGSATVIYDTAIITFNEIAALIENLGYRVPDAGRPRSRRSVVAGAGKLVIIIALYTLARALGLGGLASAFPLAQAGMGYGMLLVIGLVSSVHCVVMCGGINLSQCMSSPAAPAVRAGPPDRARALLPPILYNAGRIVSYTATGVIVGALGSVISVSGRFQGIVQLVAGIFMVIMGINMLDLFPALRRLSPRLPAALHRRVSAVLAVPSSLSRDAAQGAARGAPLIVGLLNGFMPCGPLQAMQLYALSTGNPLAGGIAMFLFGAGTLPLMFGIGALGSVLSRAARGPVFTRRVLQVGAVLITVMGMTMFSYGLGLSGFGGGATATAVPTASVPTAPAASPALRVSGERPASPETALDEVDEGVQIVNSTLSGGRYPAITVRRGIPVRWTIDAPAGSITGCNNRMIIREYGIEYQFKTGKNVIEFTPTRAGRFTYTCWMGMIRSSITVVEEEAAVSSVVNPLKQPQTDRVMLWG